MFNSYVTLPEGMQNAAIRSNMQRYAAFCFKPKLVTWMFIPLVDTWGCIPLSKWVCGISPVLWVFIWAFPTMGDPQYHRFQY